MKRLSYRNHPYFYHYLCFLVIWFTIRAFQWYDYQPEQLHYILQNTGYDVLSSGTLCFVFVGLAKWALRRKQLSLKIGIFVVVSVCYPTVYFFLTSSLKMIWELELHTQFTWEGIRSVTYRNLLFVVTLNGVFFWTYYRLQYQQQLEVSHRAESLAKDAKLLMLRYQINPHFLFNILNSLYALIDEDRGQAKDLIIKLSEYYRSALKSEKPQLTIGEELEIVSQYLEIQKIRFGEQLRTSIEVDDSLLECEIPCFVLHLLVENAVKYAVREPDGGLSISVRIRAKNGKLELSVRNPGKLANADSPAGFPHNGTQHGLENIRNRLGLYFGDRATLTLEESDDRVEAVIRIPLDPE